MLYTLIGVNIFMLGWSYTALRAAHNMLRQNTELSQAMAQSLMNHASELHKRALLGSAFTPQSFLGNGVNTKLPN